MPEGAPPNAPVVAEPAASEIRGPVRPSVSPSRPRQSTIMGGLLVLIGAILLIGQFVHVDEGRSGWPFFIIVPGAAHLVVGLSGRGLVGEGLAIPVSII